MRLCSGQPSCVLKLILSNTAVAIASRSFLDTVSESASGACYSIVEDRDVPTAADFHRHDGSKAAGTLSTYALGGSSAKVLKRDAATLWEDRAFDDEDTNSGDDTADDDEHIFASGELARCCQTQ